VLTKKVTKLWKGQYVSIRDYELESAKQKGGLVVKHKDKVMTVSLDRLSILKPDSKYFASKTGGRGYRLVDIVFEEDVVNKRQDSLFDS